MMPVVATGSSFSPGLAGAFAAFGVAGLWAGHRGWTGRLPEVERPRSFIGNATMACLTLGPVFIITGVTATFGGMAESVGEVIGLAGLIAFVLYTIAYLADVVPVSLLPPPQRATVGALRDTKAQLRRRGWAHTEEEEDGPYR